MLNPKPKSKTKYQSLGLTLLKAGLAVLSYASCQGLIDVRSALTPDNEQCGVVSGTLDLSDKKCSDAGRDHVCCKKPDFRIKKCDVSIILFSECTVYIVF